MLLTITAAGHNLNQHLTARGAAVFDRLLESRPEDDRQSLGRLMTRLTGEMTGRMPIQRADVQPAGS